MNTGEGLHRFVDPVDGEVYLYTQFEVPDSRRMFAVFEQPDLKASFRFTVTAPAHWEVVSNSPDARAGRRPRAARRRWAFAPTPRISSYITALVAGPYAVVRDELTSRDGRVIPLGVFSRKSLSQFLDADYIFEKTKQGFEYFEAKFDCAYPFEKYDQLFVPEYNAGAMENAGAVTFTEVYVFRSKVTDAVQRAPRRHDPARARAHVVRRPRHHEVVERPVAERVVRRVGVDDRHRRGHRVDRGVDDLQLDGEELGVPPGPAALDAPGRRRPSTTSKTCRSTSTASPTPRAVRC